MSELKLIDKIRYKIENVIVNMYLKYMQLRGYILKDRTPIKCPHCKAYIEMDIDDFECMMIDEIPYWEDEEFCCTECGEDIVVNDVDWD